MLKKIKHLFQRFEVCCKACPGNVREFGMKVAAVQFWDVLIPIGKRPSYINTLSKYMIRELRPLIERYNQEKIPIFVPKQKLSETPVWVCWWQGEEQMPPVVKACVESLRKNLTEQVQLHIITFDNVEDYIDLPEHIWDKYKSGCIGPAHLSDVLRFGLLSTYGGSWIDATVYLTGPLAQQMYIQPFYTQRFASPESCPQEACRGKWCGFFLGGQKDNIIFPFMYEALCDWWSRHDRAVDYVFFDYILWAAYTCIPEVTKLIDAVPPNNENIWLLGKHLNEAFDAEVYSELLKVNEFYKLSHKGSLRMETQEGQKTLYHRILKESNVI